MSDEIVIQSRQGHYSVVFEETLLSDPASLLSGTPHFIVDSNVARLYARNLHPILGLPGTIIVEATEENKSIERTIPVIEQLVQRKVRRDHLLVAIGGGIVQDITCFIASTLLRGIPWRFVPTTLLAQADSCIGSKSSINLGNAKNILGTFYPPEKIFICPAFLDTLETRDLHSGVGEIIKVHAIEGAAAFDQLAADFEGLLDHRPTLLGYIRSALLIKKRFIEEDEFDRGIRNIFNYGHSFGHAIESATNYGVPHGIAVSIGMDMANHIAVARGLLPAEQYSRMHPVLATNYRDFAGTQISTNAVMSALMKDKKNTSTMLGLVLPIGDEAAVTRMQIPPDEAFRTQCGRFLEEFGR